MSVVALTKKILQAALFYEIWDAMKVTFKHMFHQAHHLSVSTGTADDSRHPPGALALLRYDDHQERCVGCDLCEAACPSRCIKVISSEDPERPLQRSPASSISTSPNASFAATASRPVPSMRWR